jgi:hypothetical protein
LADIKIAEGSENGKEEMQITFVNSLDGKEWAFECPVAETHEWQHALSNLQLPSVNTCHVQRDSSSSHSSLGFFDRWRFTKRRSSSHSLFSEADSKSCTSRTKPSDENMPDEHEDFPHRKFKIVAKLAQWLTRRPDAGLLRSKGILSRERKIYTSIS